MGVALTAVSLSKRYRRRGPWALREVDLAIPEGSVTALVGPNGAGKSTLIRTWVGFERPSAGHVLVEDIDPWRDRSEAIARIGYVPQAASLFRDLTPWDHLSYASQLRGGFDIASASSRLKELSIPLHRNVRELSGGQQAQLGLAVALGTRARVLLLDEPLVSLDPLARREFLAALAHTTLMGDRTVLLSSHVVTDVEEACDRLLILANGHVMLHEWIADALLQHSVATYRVDVPETVSAFPDARGVHMTLIRRPANGMARHATLDEIVVGYLSAARDELSSW